MISSYYYSSIVSVSWGFVLYLVYSTMWLFMICGLLNYHLILISQAMTTNEQIGLHKYQYFKNAAGMIENPFDKKDFALNFYDAIFPSRQVLRGRMICCGLYSIICILTFLLYLFHRTIFPGKNIWNMSGLISAQVQTVHTAMTARWTLWWPTMTSNCRSLMSVRASRLLEIVYSTGGCMSRISCGTIFCLPPLQFWRSWVSREKMLC